MGHADEPPTFRPPRQRRSRETLDRIVRSAEELLAEHGPHAVTVPEIARRAGSSVGSFYARFSGKEALLQHLDQRTWEEAHPQWDWFLDPARWRGSSLSEVVRELVRVMVRAHRKYAGRLRALGLHACLHPESHATRRTAELNAHVARHIRRLLARYRGEMSHPDPAFASVFGFQLLLATLHDRILLGGTGWNPVEVPDDRLIREMTRTWLAYMGAAPGDR